ncbi:MAG TPA: YtxH domain-containing protein [Thermomicrobiales bacterium]|nr:YtxH domain-containing protein [Thermomicrobiales bacterium]
MRTVRTAFKYFVYGLLIGLLFAPRRGDETRKMVLDWAGNAVGGLLGGGEAEG